MLCDVQKFHFHLWMDMVKQLSRRSLKASDRVSDRRQRVRENDTPPGARPRSGPVSRSEKVRAGYPPLTEEEKGLRVRVQAALDKYGMTREGWFRTRCADKVIEQPGYLLLSKFSVSQWWTGRCTQDIKDRVAVEVEELWVWVELQRAAEVKRTEEEVEAEAQTALEEHKRKKQRKARGRGRQQPRNPHVPRRVPLRCAYFLSAHMDISMAKVVGEGQARWSQTRGSGVNTGDWQYRRWDRNPSPPTHGLF